jgi:hypothetical protein
MAGTDGSAQRYASDGFTPLESESIRSLDDDLTLDDDTALAAAEE